MYTCTVNWFYVYMYCKLVLCTSVLKTGFAFAYTCTVNWFCVHLYCRHTDRNITPMDITSKRNIHGTDIRCERNVQGTDIRSKRNVQGTDIRSIKKNVQETDIIQAFLSTCIYWECTGTDTSLQYMYTYTGMEFNQQ